MAKKAKANPELDALIATAQDLFSGLGDIRVRKMFGGAGVYYDKGTGEIMTMSYRAMPETAFDDADEALAWAKLGIEAAARAQK